jgi:HlyD family secretion protein
MAKKYRVLFVLLVLVLLIALLAYFLLSSSSGSVTLQTTRVARHDLKVVISTNGIIEPVDRSEVYAPLDAFVSAIYGQEGSQIAQGRPLMRLESQTLRTALAEAKAAVLEARRQARLVTSGPPKEERTALEASIAECALQLEQTNKDLQLEESLLSKQATTLAAVENLRKQRDLLQVRLDGLKQKKTDLEARYSAEEKEWEQNKLGELNKQVALLEQQLQTESVLAPKSGVIYSLPVKPGSYVGKGDLLAQIYEPGKIRLRAYVDEPDLGRIAKGQAVVVEWDGMPNKQWNGVIEKPAEQVVALNNRSVGYVLCSVEAGPRELIPNLNVKVQITTAMKSDVLVIPRSAVIRQGGKTAVLLSEGERTVVKPVELGLVTSEEIEILSGINAGDTVVINPGEAKINP